MSLKFPFNYQPNRNGEPFEHIHRIPMVGLDTPYSFLEHFCASFCSLFFSAPSFVLQLRCHVRISIEHELRAVRQVVKLRETDQINRKRFGSHFASHLGEKVLHRSRAKAFNSKHEPFFLKKNSMKNKSLTHLNA